MPSPQHAVLGPDPAIFGSFFIFVVLGTIAVLGLSIWMHWRIAVKAGFQGGLSLILLIPGANLVMLILFAFTEWPIERTLQEKKRERGLLH